jgi:hypothetical protein
MKAGSLNLLFIIILTSLFQSLVFSQEKITLQDIQPTFEEETEISIKDSEANYSKLKSKSNKKGVSGTTIVKFKALDKITAKTSNINIQVGKKKKFGYLEIFPKKCVLSTSKNEKGVVVYMQVKDLSDKKGDKIFVFNGWTFSSSVTLRTFDHPIYDIWVTGCENI